MEHLWFHYHDRAVLEDIRRISYPSAGSGRIRPFAWETGPMT